MRKFRTSAVAIATAAALSITGASVASAQSSFSGSSLTQIGKDWGAWSEGPNGETVVETDDQVVGDNLLGDETHDDVNPEWAIKWRDATKLLGLTSIIGAIIGGINYLKYTGVLPY